MLEKRRILPMRTDVSLARPPTTWFETICGAAFAREFRLPRSWPIADSATDYIMHRLQNPDDIEHFPSRFCCARVSSASSMWCPRFAKSEGSACSDFSVLIHPLHDGPAYSGALEHRVGADFGQNAVGLPCGAGLGLGLRSIGRHIG